MHLGSLALAALLVTAEANASPQRQPGGLFPGIFGGDNAPSGPPPALPHVPAPAQHSVTSALGIMHTLTSTRLPSPFGDDDLPPNHHVGEPTTTPGIDPPGITFVADTPTVTLNAQTTVSESASQSSTAAVGVAAPNSPVKVAPPSASSVARPGTPARVSPGSDGEEVANAENPGAAQPPPEERKLKTGQTVGIFAGTFVGCIGLLVLGWYWRRFARAVGLAPHTDEEPDVILPVSESKASDGSGRLGSAVRGRPKSHWTAPPMMPVPVPPSYGGLHECIQKAMEVQRWSLRPGDVLRLPHEVPSRQPQWQPQPQPATWWRHESAAPRSPIPRHANMF